MKPIFEDMHTVIHRELWDKYVELKESLKGKLEMPRSFWNNFTVMRLVEADVKRRLDEENIRDSD